MHVFQINLLIYQTDAHETLKDFVKSFCFYLQIKYNASFAQPWFIKLTPPISEIQQLLMFYALHSSPVPTCVEFLHSAPYTATKYGILIVRAITASMEYTHTIVMGTKITEALSNLLSP